MQFGDLELQLADREFRLQRFRFQALNTFLDARLLALDLNVGRLARKSRFGQLLVVRNQLLIEVTLSPLELTLLLE